MKEEYSWTEKGTLFSNTYDDVFFHDGDGLEETDYVFLQGNNISQRLGKKDLIIGELGFGTGLNFLLTWQEWRNSGRKSGTRLTFVSCEKHPLSLDLLEKSHSCFPDLKELSAHLRKKWPPVQNGFHLLEFEEGRVALLLLFGDCYESLKKFEGKVDAWFLDGFSPAKNEDMWSENVFKQMAWHSHEETTLATFTAAGFVRRGLQKAGFEIERIKGFKHKKHMTVGRFAGFVKKSLHLDPWYRSPERIPLTHVAVIGAGMAGLNLAYYLERAGYDVTVFETEQQVAAKASGNDRGMMYPLISKKPDRLGSLTEAGHHFSYLQILDLGIEYREGILEYLSTDKKEVRFEDALSRYSPDYIELENTKYGPAVNHKKALSISPKLYAEALAGSLRAAVRFGKRLTSAEAQGEDWLLSFKDGTKECFAAVFYANAYQCAESALHADLPLRRSRGQLVYLPEELIRTEEKDLNFINYLTKAEDSYILGATFDVDDLDESFRMADAQNLLDSLEKNFPGILQKETGLNKLSGRVCFRTVLKDYFPVVGPSPNESFYKTQYGDLKHGKPISRYAPAEYKRNIFLSCGHGSRGLSFSPLSAQYLSRLLRDGIHILNTSHIQALHPGRFLVKDLKKA